MADNLVLETQLAVPQDKQIKIDLKNFFSMNNGHFISLFSTNFVQHFHKNLWIINLLKELIFKL